MTVPNLPYWLLPVHAEFETSGAISNAGRAAKLPSQFWCSQFAGKSALPKRLFHGMCNAMNDGNFTMQDTSIWGPGYTYVFEITACFENRPAVPFTLVIDWTSDTLMSYYSDQGKTDATDLTHNEYFSTQWENDGDDNKIWIGLRSSSQFYFQMQEGKNVNNDQQLSCAIDVWVYKLGSHPYPNLYQNNSTVTKAALTEAFKRHYALVTGTSDFSGWTFNPESSFRFAYLQQTFVSKYPNVYTVTVGKKYLVGISYLNSSGTRINLGQTVVRIPNLSDIGLPGATYYDPGGYGGFMIYNSGGYNNNNFNGSWVCLWAVIPPTSYAAGATTHVISPVDLTFTEIG